jgi:hypothetical protein
MKQQLCNANGVFVVVMALQGGEWGRWYIMTIL